MICEIIMIIDDFRLSEVNYQKFTILLFEMGENRTTSMKTLM